jgi:hypothetical protein
MSSPIVLLLASKGVRIALSYVAHVIAKNFTSQIYLDKVLVRGDTPPKLFHQVLMATGIEFLMFVIFISLLYGANEILKVFPNLPANVFTAYLLTDFMLCAFCTTAIGYFVSSVMYAKKYFLYKDDGLRAIRALSEIMIYVSIFLIALPLNYMVGGIVADIKRT